MPNPPVPVVSLVNEQPRTLSTDVAAFFGKRHDNVIRQIRLLVANCPDHFHNLNFEEMYLDVQIGNGGTRKEPAYSLTKDGFTLLAMGFTGPKALQFKLAYIEAFNRMEEKLTARAAADHGGEACLTPELKPRKLAQQATSQRQVLEMLKSLGGTGTSRDVARTTGWRLPRVQKIMFNLKNGGFIYHKGITPSTADCKRGLTVWAIKNQTPAKPQPRIKTSPRRLRTEEQALIKVCSDLAKVLPELITSLCLAMRELASSPQDGSEREEG